MKRLLWYYKKMKNNSLEEINCKVIEKKIPAYLSGSLSVKETKAFVNHVQECKDCKDELTIQYMVSEGLSKAESDNEYNLLKGLEQKLSGSRQMIKKYRITLFFVLLFVIASLALFAAVIYLILS